MGWNRTLTAGGYSICIFCGSKVANVHFETGGVLCFCDCEGAAKFTTDQPLTGLTTLAAPERDYSKPVKEKPKKVYQDAPPVKKPNDGDKGDLPW